MTVRNKEQNKYYVTSFYCFFQWKDSPNLKDIAEDLEAWCKIRKIRGLIILSPEGLNGTIASPKPTEEFENHLKVLSGQEITFKQSTAFEAHNPFRRTKVKLRNEIVTIGNTGINPAQESNDRVKHLSPKEWHEHMRNNPNAQIVDVRNDYEIELGSFKGSENWKMEEFTEFPELVEKSDFKKDEPVLMFCTGGIRCEKASLEMAHQGYEQVYQLDGGILNYLDQYPEGFFEGECFVFDHRVALKGDLSPTESYTLCTHCGQPASVEKFNCIQCGVETYGVCDKCLAKGEHHKTCSKNCTHHYLLGHTTKNPHGDSTRARYGKFLKPNLDGPNIKEHGVGS